ncbi:tetratricopeptide repeat protein [Crossiella sp. SN42]|uniref:tetratricopeptide repeat protein n=1 Tax=Crossiella sp. SN42 TaxID=2944808 RepID=UPI00207C6489|nr:tetratricopeptide repeat protein [Crossiella sp. SN42]MCO1574460.1 tetratricopeptide repeat protein [Crossiella sp. SN42]
MHRDAELAGLDRLAEEHWNQGRSMVAVLSGLSGVGKTAIAVQWAHRNHTRFGGGQLYADLNEYRHRGVVDLNEVAAGFLRALGRNGELPSRFTERIGLFRTMTAESNVLVLLDNADQAAQVRQFVPGSPAGAVLVTSRIMLNGLRPDGVELIPVRPLDQERGVELLRELTNAGGPGHDQASLERLAGFCGGLPLALLVVGALLTGRRHWSPVQLLDYFGDDGLRLSRLSQADRDSFDQLFETAAGQLSTESRVVYHCVGAHPGPDFGQQVLAAATGLPVAAVDEALEQLGEAHLVERLTEDRYRMHELVKLHASQSARRSAGHAVVLRGIVDWYRHGAAAADRAVLGEHRWRLAPRHDAAPVFAFAPDTGMRWFELERRNLLAAVRCAADQGWHEAVWQLCEALWPSYHTRKHFADSIEAHQLGVVAAERCGHQVAEIRMRNQLARARMELGAFAAAEQDLEEAHSKAAAGGDERAIAAVVESYGVLRRSQGRVAESAGHFRQALALNERLADERGIAMQSYQLGGVQAQLGEATAAIGSIRRALAIFVQLGEEFSAGRARLALGDAYAALGQDREACVELAVAARIMRIRRQPEREVRALRGLVAALERMGGGDLLANSRARLRELTGGLDLGGG